MSINQKKAKKDGSNIAGHPVDIVTASFMRLCSEYADTDTIK